MSPGDPRGKLLAALDRFFTETLPLSDDTLLVAFSGGADSAALLWGLTRLADRRRVVVEAVHVDHGLDVGSQQRARAAARLCRTLSVPLTVVPGRVSGERLRARGREAAARDVRYRELERMRIERGASWVLTAHQRDDQIETVLMRLLQGTGWEGLAGISPCHRRVVRPLLGLHRTELREAVAAAGLPVVRDPANRDLSLERNRVRDHSRPYLEGLYPDVGNTCVALAEAARGARRVVRERLARLLDPVVEGSHASLDLGVLRRLPPALLAPAVALLHRRAGVPYPPSTAAVAELARQMTPGGRIGSDCGDGWSWRSHGRRLHLERIPESPPKFTYTFEVPGSVEVAELALRVHVARAHVEPWMFEGSPRRAGLGARIDAGERVVVRNRRPGDRLQPLGCDYARRLKEVLIDKRVPREERDRIPLLCVGERIAWVPGVTIDEAFRIRDGESAWVAEVQPA